MHGQSTLFNSCIMHALLFFGRAEISMFLKGNTMPIRMYIFKWGEYILMYEYHVGAEESGRDSYTCYITLLHHHDRLIFCFPWSPSPKAVCWERGSSGLCSNVRFSTGGCGELMLLIIFEKMFSGVTRWQQKTRIFFVFHIHARCQIYACHFILSSHIFS